MAVPLLIGLILIVAVGAGRSMAAPGGPQKPEFGPGLDPESLARKALIIKKGFLIAVDKRRAFIASKKAPESQQQSLNNAAAYFQRRGIPLGKPDPSVPFWSKTEKQIADTVASVVNRYLPPETA